MSSARLSHRSMSIKTVLKIISQEPSSLIICRSLLKTLGFEKALLLSIHIDESVKHNGAFYMPYRKLSKELGMKEYTIRKCKSELIRLGLIKTEMRGVPAKEWIEINVESLMDFRNQNKEDG